MAEHGLKEQKLTRQQRKNLNVMRLFEKAQKFQLKRLARDKNMAQQNTITFPILKKKLKLTPSTTKGNSSVPSDGVSTTNLNECSSNSFDTVPAYEIIKPIPAATLNQDYGIKQQEVFFHLMDYKNTQKEKTLARMNVSPEIVCGEESGIELIDECSPQLFTKTMDVFQKVSSLFNLAKPSVASMHQFKLKSIIKG